MGIRIIVILMLLIVSSTVLELIQSFLPIPDMISSAALAIVAGIFIGWEENREQSNGWLRIYSRHSPDFHSTEENELDVKLTVINRAFGSVTVFILITSLLFTGLGVLGG